MPEGTLLLKKTYGRLECVNLAERLLLKIPRSISLGKYYTISVVYHSRVCLILSFKQLTVLPNLLLPCL